MQTCFWGARLHPKDCTLKGAGIVTLCVQTCTFIFSMKMEILNWSISFGVKILQIKILQTEFRGKCLQLEVVPWVRLSIRSSWRRWNSSRWTSPRVRRWRRSNPRWWSSNTDRPRPGGWCFLRVSARGIRCRATRRSDRSTLPKQRGLRNSRRKR